MQKKQAKDDEKAKREDLSRHVPIARRLLRLVVEAELTVGEIDVTRSRPEEYAKVAEAIMRLFLDENIRWVDRQFVFQLALQPLSLLQQIVMTDLDRTLERSLSRAMGVREYKEMTMRDVERPLLDGVG